MVKQASEETGTSLLLTDPCSVTETTLVANAGKVEIRLGFDAEFKRKDSWSLCQEFLI